MPPKRGVTEEGVLAALGARVDLSLATAGRCIEDPTVGFAYVSQREYAPRAYALRHLRAHIAKRPPWATTEKAQQLFAGAAWNGMVAGFYHAGYEDKLLGLMQGRGLDAGLVIKGEEGSSHYGLRLGKPSDVRRKAINYVQGFRARWWFTDDGCLRRGPEGIRLLLRAESASCGGECAGICRIGRGGTQGRAGACLRPHRA